METIELVGYLVIALVGMVTAVKIASECVREQEKLVDAAARGQIFDAAMMDVLSLSEDKYIKARNEFIYKKELI